MSTFELKLKAFGKNKTAENNVTIQLNDDHKKYYSSSKSRMRKARPGTMEIWIRKGQEEDM